MADAHYSGGNQFDAGEKPIFKFPYYEICVQKQWRFKCCDPS